MADFLAVLLVATCACWLAIGMAGRWEQRRRVLMRLNRQLALPGQEQWRNSLLVSSLAARFLRSSLVRKDYHEVSQLLRLTGRSPDAIQILYVLLCWLLPSVLLVIGLLFSGLLFGFLLSAIAFIGARRAIRSIAASARHRQNLESIELAQMLAMLLEAGLSVERAFRIAALQARPLIPSLLYRLERFNRLMDSGADRSSALDEMGEGKEIPVLHALVRLLKQAGALGGSLGESLEQLIVEARDIERSRIKEQVNRVGAKMTVVMMCFMLPALFILIGGPAGLNIVQALSR